jgi:sugar phosphate isomerase/epimerase
MSHSRRDLLKLTLGALPAAHLLTWPRSLRAASKPDSRIRGVQIGIIAPYAFRGTARSAEEILEKLVELGISGVEMQSPPVERFAGAPEGGWRGPRPGRPGGPPPGPPRPPRRRELTPEEQAARRAWAEKMRAWRLAAPMDKFAELGRTYTEAGVRIYAFKLALTESMPDEEYDYCFDVAKALGANHVTMELSENTERIGRFAAKHQVHVGYHNHTQVDEQSWDAALAQSPYNGINLDVGHFTAAIGKSPIPFIRKHHARITSMHLKDREYGTDGNNLPWGQGDTPLREVLQLMKKERYTFPATIELEYPVPEGSTVMAELERCRRFCEEALAQA